jgi:sodium-coupled neutral amino acid transporter 11
MNMEQRGRSSYLGASFNFVNSIVGAGIIGIPYAVSECGFFTGIMMLTFVAYLVNRSVLMLIECGIKARKYNFAYGAQVAYLVIVGDTIPVVSKILFHSSFTDRTAVVTLLAVFIILPLCFLKNLSSLSWTSMLSIFADTLLILILVVASPEEASREKIKPVFNFINSSLFAGIGTISFAFVCQHNCFLVFQSLTEQTYDNWKKVANLSVGFSFFLW